MVLNKDRVAGMLGESGQIVGEELEQVDLHQRIFGSVRVVFVRELVVVESFFENLRFQIEVE